MKNLRFLSITAILVVILAGLIGIGTASAQTTVCSPATELAVPVVKNTMGKFCWHTTSLCYQVNSWYTTELSINGTSYKNMFVLSSAIPALNGGYTITFDGGNIPYAPGHIEITGPYQGSGNGPCDSVPATSTPTGPTATLTRTPTQIIGASPTNGPTATRTRTPTQIVGASPTRTATQAFTPTSTPIAPTATVTGGTCSPATTITTPFAKDGAGTFCWRISTLGTINSYNLTSLSINGVNFTNMWAPAANLPPQIGGYWYISYTAAAQYGHFEAQP